MMFIIVPNQHISFRESWFGALLAAVAIQAYLQLFPFYATHFLGGYTGTVGFAIIFIFFFYYFGVILLAGAEINAFYQGKRALPENLAVWFMMSHRVCRKVKKRCKRSKGCRVVLHTVGGLALMARLAISFARLQRAGGWTADPARSRSQHGFPPG